MLHHIADSHIFLHIYITFIDKNTVWGDTHKLFPHNLPGSGDQALFQVSKDLSDNFLFFFTSFKL